MEKPIRIDIRVILSNELIESLDSLNSAVRDCFSQNTLDFLSNRLSMLISMKKWDAILYCYGLEIFSNIFHRLLKTEEYESCEEIKKFIEKHNKEYNDSIKIVITD